MNILNFVIEPDFIWLIIGGIVISIVIFLIIREILCWYWKINLSISIQQDILSAIETQNEILKKTLEYQTNQQNNSDTNEEEPIKLSEKEEIEVAKFLKFGLKTGEKLVIHKKTRKIDSVNEEEWKKILKNFEQDDWLIIEEK